MEHLGFRFWAGFVGALIAGAFALFIALLLFTRAIYAWGLLGAFLAIAAVALVAAWIHDRRDTRRQAY